MAFTKAWEISFKSTLLPHNNVDETYTGEESWFVSSTIWFIAGLEVLMLVYCACILVLCLANKISYATFARQSFGAALTICGAHLVFMYWAAGLSDFLKLTLPFCAIGLWQFISDGRLLEHLDWFRRREKVINEGHGATTLNDAKAARVTSLASPSNSPPWKATQQTSRVEGATKYFVETFIMFVFFMIYYVFSGKTCYFTWDALVSFGLLFALFNLMALPELLFRPDGQLQPYLQPYVPILLDDGEAEKTLDAKATEDSERGLQTSSSRMWFFKGLLRLSLCYAFYGGWKKVSKTYCI